MGVIFDEVVGQVETPPRPPQEQQQSGEQQQSPQHEAYSWQLQQSIFLRRQQRLEAD